MSRQELAEAVARWLFDATSRGHAIDANYIGKLERGEHRWPNADYRAAFRAVLGTDADADLGFYNTYPQRIASVKPESVICTEPGGTNEVLGQVFSQPSLHDMELLRQNFDEVLTEGAMAQGEFDDWERSIAGYGKATRNRPAGMLLNDLISDLAELKRALRRHRSASAIRHLTRTTAQMAGLMCLTLCKLDDRVSFRKWARTARLAADEADDAVTHSWVLAQESYGHFYSEDITEAVDTAQHAQSVASATPCAGAALAAALEARAHAVMQNGKEARAALGRAEDILSHLEGDELSSSAFGYNEAQFRFHEGNAYTHLRDTRAAFDAQDRALHLCAPGDYTDWAMTRLDRSRCLISAGEISDALHYAVETLTSLTEQQRHGIVLLRGRQLLRNLPADRQVIPAARDLHDLLT